MKASKITVAAILSVFATAAMAFDGSEGRGGRRRGAGGGGSNRGISMWYCRADARDDSGLFFLGMGRDRANAYVQALESCSRQNRVCTITCSPNVWL